MVARVVATATACVLWGSVQPANTTIWALTRAEVESPDLWKRLVEAEDLRLQEYTPQGLSNLAWAAAKARRSLLNVGLINERKLISNMPPWRKKNGGEALRTPPTPFLRRGVLLFNLR